MVKKIIAALAASFLISSSIFAATVPALKGRVNDYAKIIRDSDEREIEEYLAGLEQSSGIQIAVLTMPSLDGEDISSFGIRVADKWNLGDKESAVIYGSFLYLRCDKKTQDKYKQLIPEIKQNFKKVAENFKNKTWLSEIKITKKMVFRFIFFIICLIYIIRNYKDLNSFF